MRNMLKRTIVLMLVSAMLVLSLAGCGPKKSGGGSVNGNGVKILVAIHDETDSFLNTLIEAIQAKATSVGATTDVVTCGGDATVQRQQIAEAAGKGYDAVICRLADATTILQMEIAAGDTPIVFINNEPSSDYLKADKFIYVGSYEQDAGRYQAEYIWNGLGKPSSLNLIIMEGQKGHAAVPQRTNAVKYFFLDNGVDANIVFCDYGDWSDTVAYDRLDMFKITGQPFDCIICNNDPMAIGAINWLKDNGYDTHKVLVAGIDATDDGCAAVRAGDLYMTVLQDTVGQGEAAIESAITLAKGKSVSTLSGATEDLKYVWVPFVPITPSNIDQYK
ncbi:MAG: substrate-binding domain-containing protein [Lachnospiraceae bacterium]|nr:substrate-binding domain-containing protein [Lachnospiraceae bacterium]